MQFTGAFSVPLAHYRQHRASVSLQCLDCMEYRTFDLEAVIRRPEARGLGGEQTGVEAPRSLCAQTVPTLRRRTI
jgi:hypothetical protein